LGGGEEEGSGDLKGLKIREKNQGAGKEAVPTHTIDINSAI